MHPHASFTRVAIVKCRQAAYFQAHRENPEFFAQEFAAGMNIRGMLATKLMECVDVPVTTSPATFASLNRGRWIS